MELALGSAWRKGVRSPIKFYWFYQLSIFSICPLSLISLVVSPWSCFPSSPSIQPSFWNVPTPQPLRRVGVSRKKSERRYHIGKGLKSGLKDQGETREVGDRGRRSPMWDTSWRPRAHPKAWEGGVRLCPSCAERSPSWLLVLTRNNSPNAALLEKQTIAQPTLSSWKVSRGTLYRASRTTRCPFKLLMPRTLRPWSNVWMFLSHPILLQASSPSPTDYTISPPLLHCQPSHAKGQRRISLWASQSVRGPVEAEVT